MSVAVCPSCGHENIEGVDNCDNCGKSLSGLDLPENYESPNFIRQSIAGVPRRQASQVKPGDPVGLAVHHMQREEMNCVLVMDDGKLAGIITGWDILQKVAGPSEDLNAATCGQVMTREPQTLNEDDNLAVAFNLMASGGFRHVPIVKDGQPIGVIIANDLFRHISPHLV